MDADARAIDPLLQRWRELPSGARNGILKRLPVEQRLTFRRLIAASDLAEAETAARARRFRTCSPWLGELLDACERDGTAAAGLKPIVRSALLTGYEQADAAGTVAEAAPTLAAFSRSLVKSVREWL